MSWDGRATGRGQAGSRKRPPARADVPPARFSTGQPPRHRMTSRELVRRALRGEPTPRPAVGPLAVHCTARLAGVSLREFTLDAGVLAACVVRYHREFQPDAIWLSADTWVSAEAMGAKVAFPGDDQPLGGTGEPLIQTDADIARIPPPDPTKQGRWPLMIDALRRIRRAVGRDVFVVACFDQYPFSLACAAMGIEKAMMAAMEDRPLLRRLLERCADYAVAYAGALAEAGADLLSGGDSPAALLGPELHREIAFPFEQHVIARIRAATSVPVDLTRVATIACVTRRGDALRRTTGGGTRRWCCRGDRARRGGVGGCRAAPAGRRGRWCQGAGGGGDCRTTGGRTRGGRRVA